MTIELSPPAQPERMPGPCARCGCADGVALYATSRVTYFGCVNCRHLKVVTAGADLEAASPAPPGSGQTGPGAPTRP